MRMLGLPRKNGCTFLAVGDLALVNRRKGVELNQQRNVGDVRRHEIHPTDATAGQLRNNLIAVANIGRIKRDAVCFEVGFERLVIALPSLPRSQS